MTPNKRNGLAIYAGGNHIFYIAGVLKFFTEKGLRFDAVATYSAGSAILPFLIDDKLEDAPEVFGRYLDRNVSNFYPAHLFTKDDIFPHDRIYSTAIAGIVDFQKTVDYNKPLRVIVSEFESHNSADGLVGLCAFVALLLNSLAKTATPSIFLRMFKSLFSIEGNVVDLRQCKSNADIVEVILGSSTIYPFIHIRRRSGRSMLDGKLSLTSPIEALEDCEHVISIHAHRSFLPRRDNLISVFPLAKVEVGPLDYVGSAGVKSAFAQGYREGAAHHARLANSPFFANEGRH
jgi:predicted acylesterase/phospholipase RssA